MMEGGLSTLYLVLSDDDPALLATLSEYAWDRRVQVTICIVAQGDRPERIIELSRGVPLPGIKEAIEQGLSLIGPSPVREGRSDVFALVEERNAQLAQTASNLRLLLYEIRFQDFSVGGKNQKIRKKKGWPPWRGPIPAVAFSRNRTAEADAYTQKRS